MGSINFWIDLLGWIGAFALVAAYGLISNNKLQGDSQFFQWLNLLGGALLLINTAYNGAFPAAFVNVVWIVIAVLALVTIWKGRAKERARLHAD